MYCYTVSILALLANGHQLHSGIDIARQPAVIINDLLAMLGAKSSESFESKFNENTDAIFVPATLDGKPATIVISRH